MGVDDDHDESDCWKKKVVGLCNSIHLNNIMNEEK